MAFTNQTYPAKFNDDAGITRYSGNIIYTSTSAQPAVQSPISSGALPDTGAWVSGTAKVNPATRNITVAVEVVGDNTANAATCAIAISPDDTTYTTLGTVTIDATVNTGGVDKQLVCVPLPQGWYIKLTLSHATVAASKYW